MHRTTSVQNQIPLSSVSSPSYKVVSTQTEHIPRPSQANFWPQNIGNKQNYFISATLVNCFPLTFSQLIFPDFPGKSDDPIYGPYNLGSASEMTYIVSSGALNSTHSLTYLKMC